MKSTQAMRDRVRELSSPHRDDYDRAVECVLDDLEGLLRLPPQGREPSVDFGFASFSSGRFELIVRDRKTWEETVLTGTLEPGQFELIDRILPTCVYVEGVPRPLNVPPPKTTLQEKLRRFAAEVERCEHGHFLIDIAKAIRWFAMELETPAPPESIPAEAANAWQSIETAPEDGQSILVSMRGGVDGPHWVVYWNGQHFENVDNGLEIPSDKR